MLPTTIYAGDSLDFDTVVAGYSAADGWALTFRLVPQAQGGSPVSISTLANGEAHNANVSASTTASWGAGAYTWLAYVTKAGERFTVANGRLEIAANPATAAAGLDTRTHARKVLEAIDALIEGRATVDQEEISIAGRSLKRIPVPDLIKLRQTYVAEVRREDDAARIAAGMGTSRRVYVRFASA